MAAICTRHGVSVSQAYHRHEQFLAGSAPPSLWEKEQVAHASLLPHLTRDTGINVSARYETGDPSRLIRRLRKYAPASRAKARSKQ